MDVLPYVLGFLLVGAVVVVLVWLRRARREIKCTRLYPNRIVRIEVRGNWPVEEVVSSVLEMIPKFGAVEDVIVEDERYREPVLKALREKGLLN